MEGFSGVGEETRTLAETVIWLAEERSRKDRIAVNTAINTIMVEVGLALVDYLKEHNWRRREG